jgi:pimeloyl-CoA dehydrogenase
MDFELDATQRAFREEVRAFIRERLPADLRERMRRGHAPRKQDTVAWQRALNERGWAAPHWPREYGGAGLDTARRLILLEELFRAPAPLPQGFNINLLGTVLLRYGTEEQKRFFLPKLTNLDLWFCQGFSEPGSGSDLASLRTKAVRDGDHYIVDGQKIWTTSAHVADWIFALVRTEPCARKQDGISFLLIDMKSPGVTVRPIVSIDGQHHLNEVFFDSVRVPVANLVGEEGRGWDCAKYLLLSERASVASVGLLRERLDHAREVAASRAGGIGPKLASELAVLGAEIRALELTNWRFLLDPEIERSNPGFASTLKLKGSRADPGDHDAAGTPVGAGRAGASRERRRAGIASAVGHRAALLLLPRDHHLRRIERGAKGHSGQDAAGVRNDELQSERRTAADRRQPRASAERPLRLREAPRHCGGRGRLEPGGVAAPRRYGHHRDRDSRSLRRSWRRRGGPAAGAAGFRPGAGAGALPRLGRAGGHRGVARGLRGAEGRVAAAPRVGRSATRLGARRSRRPERCGLCQRACAT